MASGVSGAAEGSGLYYERGGPKAFTRIKDIVLYKCTTLFWFIEK